MPYTCRGLRRLEGAEQDEWLMASRAAIRAAPSTYFTLPAVRCICCSQVHKCRREASRYTQPLLIMSAQVPNSRFDPYLIRRCLPQFPFHCQLVSTYRSLSYTEDSVNIRSGSGQWMERPLGSPPSWGFVFPQWWETKCSGISQLCRRATAGKSGTRV